MTGLLDSWDENQSPVHLNSSLKKNEVFQIPKLEISVPSDTTGSGSFPEDISARFSVGVGFAEKRNRNPTLTSTFMPSTALSKQVKRASEHDTRTSKIAIMNTATLNTDKSHFDSAISSRTGPAEARRTPQIPELELPRQSRTPFIHDSGMTLSHQQPVQNLIRKIRNETKTRCSYER